MFAIHGVVGGGGGGCASILKHSDVQVHSKCGQCLIVHV